MVPVANGIEGAQISSDEMDVEREIKSIKGDADSIRFSFFTAHRIQGKERSWQLYSQSSNRYFRLNISGYLKKMKLSILSTGLAILAQFVSAAPTPTEGEALAQRAEIAKRATITDVATVGFATQNGG